MDCPRCVVTAPVTIIACFAGGSAWLQSVRGQDERLHALRVEKENTAVEFATKSAAYAVQVSELTSKVEEAAAEKTVRDHRVCCCVRSRCVDTVSLLWENEVAMSHTYFAVQVLLARMQEVDHQRMLAGQELAAWTLRAEAAEALALERQAIAAEASRREASSREEADHLRTQARPSTSLPALCTSCVRACVCARACVCVTRRDRECVCVRGQLLTASHRLVELEHVAEQAERVPALEADVRSRDERLRRSVDDEQQLRDAVSDLQAAAAAHRITEETLNVDVAQLTAQVHTLQVQSIADSALCCVDGGSPVHAPRGGACVQMQLSKVSAEHTSSVAALSVTQRRLHEALEQQNAAAELRERLTQTQRERDEAAAAATAAQREVRRGCCWVVSPLRLVSYQCTRSLLRTVHHPPSTIHHPPSTIHHPPSTIHHPPSTIHHPPSTALPDAVCPPVLTHDGRAVGRDAVVQVKALRADLDGAKKAFAEERALLHSTIESQLRDNEVTRPLLSAAFSRLSGYGESALLLSRRCCRAQVLRGVTLAVAVDRRRCTRARGRSWPRTRRQRWRRSRGAVLSCSTRCRSHAAVTHSICGHMYRSDGTGRFCCVTAAGQRGRAVPCRNCAGCEVRC